jgi:hypothetical protein
MSCSISVSPVAALPATNPLARCKLTKEPSDHRLRCLLLGPISVALKKSPDVSWYLDYVNKQYLVIYTRITK